MIPAYFYRRPHDILYREVKQKWERAILRECPYAVTDKKGHPL